MSLLNPIGEPRCEKCKHTEDLCTCFVEVRDEQGYVIEVNEKKVDTSSGDEHMQDENPNE